MDTGCNENNHGFEAQDFKAKDTDRNHGANGSGKAMYDSMVTKDSNGFGREAYDEELSPDKVIVLYEDYIVSDSGEFPNIKFSNRVHDQIDSNMKNVIIVRLLGLNIGYGTLLNRVHAMWKPKGEIHLIDLENNYFLVWFEDSRNYAMVLTDGPWKIFGNSLTMQPWSRSFSTSEKHPYYVVVWVRLPGLPYRYYCKALFRRIAQVVGDVIKIDYNSQAGERGKFARLAIMFDLNKPLKSCIGIDNFVKRLEYEGLQHICFMCGVYGHSQDESGSEKRPGGGGNHTTEIQEVRGLQEDGAKELYGPLMIATNRRRRPTSVPVTGRNDVENLGPALGSQFVVLQEDSTIDVMEADILAGMGVVNAHHESNPARRSKHVGNKVISGDEVEVVSLVPRSEVTIDPYKSTSDHIQADIEAIRFRSDQENAMEEDGREGDSPHAISHSLSGAEPGLVDGNRQGGSGVPPLL
ncbi:hypothetical protein GQ457_14G021980 [Hibiscus cannabinus]